jgi:hypothetical protein
MPTWYTLPSDLAHDSAELCRICTNLRAYFAIVEFGNISLTLPPATLKKADPQNPVISRKIKKTAAVLSQVNCPFRGHTHLPALGANATGNVKIKNKA